MMTFITVWEVDNDDRWVHLPLVGQGKYHFAVDWGDSSARQTITNANIAESVHEYPLPGRYTVQIAGKLTGWSFQSHQSTGDAEKLAEIKAWGGFQPGDAVGAFAGANNMTISATDIPELSHTTTLKDMFLDCEAIKDIPNIGQWDLSKIEDISGMFRGAFFFDAALNEWNTSSIKDMSNLFRDAGKFNHPIGSWDTSGVTNMEHLFHGTMLFNQPLNSWDVSQVTNMRSMFENTTSFNQDLDQWSVNNVVKFGRMFYAAQSFNGKLNAWRPEAAQYMTSMFQRAMNFNQEISDWTTGTVLAMDQMFYGTLVFDQDISTWDISSIHTMKDMFTNSLAFSSSNYDKLLNGWIPSESNEFREPPRRIPLGMGTTKYTEDGESARETLIQTYAWEITDGGRS